MAELPLNYQRLESALGVPSEEQKHSNWLARRWHKAQSSPTWDTAAKKLARASGSNRVRCICGCRQEFSAVVR